MRLNCKLLDVYLPRRRARRLCALLWCLLVPYRPLALVLLERFVLAVHERAWRRQSCSRHSRQRL